MELKMADFYSFPNKGSQGILDTGEYGVKDIEQVRERAEVKRGQMDLPFFAMTLVILTIGLIMVFSASFARAYYESGNPAYVFVRQFIFSVSGVAIMLIASRIKPTFFRRYSFWLLVFSIGLLVLVPIIGEESGGAKRWIDLKITGFQPSEIAKLAVVLSFASMICIYKDKMKTFRYGVLPFVLIIGIIVGLLILEPHLSASVIIIALGGIMMFVGGTRLRWFAIVAIFVALAAVVLLSNFDYASGRIAAWRDPLSQKLTGGWQIVQSLYAVGSGGLLGLGLGQGRQKHLYLPEEHNDFIFAVVCEELGFIGAALIIILFAILILRGFWLALRARDRFGSLVITGLTSLLALQVFLNVAVVTNLIPCTGISLPFFSSGGTALWLQMLEMGIILSISREIKDK
jgi:cell division protein FtsW